MDKVELSSLPSLLILAVSNAVNDTVHGLQDHFTVLLGQSECTGETHCFQDYYLYEIAMLLNGFGSRLTRKCFCIDAVTPLFVVKTFTKDCFMDKSYLDLMRLMLTKETYRKLLHLIEIVFGIPVSSCEKIVSCHTHVCVEEPYRGTRVNIILENSLV